MTAEQKIENIECQIDDLMRARRIGVRPYGKGSIHCPYCDSTHVEGEPLCCNSMGRAVAAILLRKDVQEKAETAERIAEKVTRN